MPRPVVHHVVGVRAGVGLRLPIASSLPTLLCPFAFRYGILGLLMFIGFMFCRGAFLYIWAMGAAQRIHEKSVHRVLFAPLGFFFSVGCWSSCIVS